MFLYVHLSGGIMVPRRGLEPPRLSPLVPETSASTNSAIWAGAAHIRLPDRACQRDVVTGVRLGSVLPRRAAGHKANRPCALYRFGPIGYCACGRRHFGTA